MLAVAAALAILASAHAQKPGETNESATALLNIALSYLTNADAERDGGNAEDAATLYREAAEKYGALARRYPDWQTEIIRYRISYCKEQLGELKRQAKAPGATNAAPGALPVPDGAAPEQRGKLDIIKAHAARLLHDGDPARARSLLLDALRINPDDTGIRLMLAIAQCQAAAYGDAALILTQLIEEEPTNAVAHATLGAAYLGEGRMEDAAGETSIALTLNDRDPAAHYNMTRIFLHAAPPDLEKAGWHYRKFVELGGKPDPALEATLKAAEPSAASGSATNAPDAAPAGAPIMPPTNAPPAPDPNEAVTPATNATATPPLP